MKRLLPLLLMLLFLVPALAEDEPTALFLAAHPGYEITDSDTEGDIAAAILVQGTDKALCVAERVNGAWTLTIDNPKALNQNEAYQYRIAVSPDAPIVYWESQPWDTCETFSARLENDVWKLDPPVFITNWGNDFREIMLSWGDGKLCRTQYISDENGNILSMEDLLPLPASWLDGATLLKDFDVSLLPTFLGDIPTVMDGQALKLAAGELLPDYAYVGGSLLADELQLLMDKPDGSRVFIGATYDGDWRLTESAPLPPSTRYGNENFSDYLYIPHEMTIGVHHWPDGTWGVNFLMSDDGGMYHLGQNYFADYLLLYDPENLIVGDIPWSDITVIDWTTLPHTLEEAHAAIDNSGWAMVNNPNPEDRLHLREKPDRSSRSQGKYYNGTFVRVLEQKGDWTRVSVFGIEGWMMTDYLAFGQHMETVARVNLLQSVREDLPYATLYQTPDGEIMHPFSGQALVLGVIEDAWYHVMTDDGETGYIRQEELWGGNG